MFDLLLPPGIKVLEGVLEILKEESLKIRSVLPAVFSEKAVLKNFQEIPRNHP